MSTSSSAGIEMLTEKDIAALEAELEEWRTGKRRLPKKPRPEKLEGWSQKIETSEGKLFVQINDDENGEPFEAFINLGKAGRAAYADAEAIGRLISLALRFYVPAEEIRKQLRGISCDQAMGIGPNKVLSIPDAIGIAIGNHLADKGVQIVDPFDMQACEQGVSEEVIEITAPKKKERPE